ncbi:MAG TPA: DsrE/DsrF/DrsH-like family protein [Thermomicrobiales bacterium]|nr:DsrE/DsrF/DrsH-like family protein [Thermomicrobiales bacterium]
MLTETTTASVATDCVDALTSPASPDLPTTTTRLAIIATKGALDWAYPPLMMAVQAANKGWDVGIFFTFYGLNVIHKDKHRRLKVSPVGNPAMPMEVPNILAALPGMTAMATRMMRRRLRQQQVPTIEELLHLAIERGVKLYPCGFTIDTFGYEEGDFIAGVQPRTGSPDFLEFAKDANSTIFV